jgi:RimJ/RimL family protein N-acetyltransferase
LEPIETQRLLIRTFTLEDLATLHRLLDVELAHVDLGDQGAMSLDARRRYLEWNILSDEQFAALNQPPYGDRAVVLKTSGELVGSIGLVPALNQFEHLPGFAAESERLPTRFNTPEVGLYYAFFPAHQRQGYATEAAQALINYAFSQLNVKRLIAETNFDNQASIAVMRKLGMRIERNPEPEPPWLQVVGVIYNPAMESRY